MHDSHGTSRVRIPDLSQKKKSGRKVTMLTAYDATMARLLDRSGVDVLLVGDSLGHVILGYETTIPVTLDAMIHHSRAVANGTRRALAVTDMPFLTYQGSAEEAMRNAGRIIQAGGAAAVEMEGGAVRARAGASGVEASAPVMVRVRRSAPG